ARGVADERAGSRSDGAPSQRAPISVGHGRAAARQQHRKNGDSKKTKGFHRSTPIGSTNSAAANQLAGFVKQSILIGPGNMRIAGQAVKITLLHFSFDSLGSSAAPSLAHMRNE